LEENRTGSDVEEVEIMGYRMRQLGYIVMFRGV
jgi:hypothetical protein